MTRVLRLFASAVSVRRLRLCFAFRSCLLKNPDAPDPNSDGTSAEELDRILASPSEDNAFRALRAVEFAWHVDDWDEALWEHYPLLSAWVQRTFPQLHERCAVEVCTYKCVISLH